MSQVFRFPLYACCFLLIYMPFHIFLSQWLSTFTGGLDAWKVGKDVFLLLAILLTLVILLAKRGLSDRYFWILAFAAAAYYAIHLLVWAANPEIDTRAALLGTAYNCRLFAYVLLAWAAVLIYPGRPPLKKIFKIAIIVSSIVATLGIIQFLLPNDAMMHFGYSLERGVKPAFFIDDKSDLERVMSTIRDPNSLGAYLILPITALSVAFFRLKNKRLLLAVLLALHLVALLLTFSRSAWLGAVLAVGLVLLWTYKKQIKTATKKYWPLSLIALCSLLIALFVLRDQYFVQNVIFHADENTRLTNSNDLHFNLARAAAEGIVDKPLGHGPGTAGLVSIQTSNVVLTENYFLQTGYEVGLHGLVVMLALMAFTILLLYKQKSTGSRILIAAFAGITLCAFLLHTWSNEAVAAQWWLMAGFLLGAATAKEAVKPRVRRQSSVK